MDNKLCFINSLTFQLEASARIFYLFAKNSFLHVTKNKISLEEYAVLETLILYPHLNVNTLAKTLMRDNVFVEKILAKLLKKKLIEEVKKSEIQVQYYRLTRNGERIYQENAFASDGMLPILLKFISEKELLSFTKTLLKIRNIIISLDA